MQLPERVLHLLDNMESLTEHCPDWLESCLTVDQNLETPEVTNNVDYGSKSSEERQGTYTRLKSASKPHSTPLTLKWLDENYEIAEGVCIPRSTLYVHYLDYCEKHDTQPVNAASFGKIIRQQFPQLTTRRLGTRGQSKYHYYGIGVRETSPYYEIGFSVKGVQSSLDGKKENLKQIISYSPRSKLGTLLPEFPDIKDIKLPSSVPEEKVLTFLMMYRTHCQRILDTVIRANFDEVQGFLLHFWQGMPTHIKTILDSKILVTLVGVCDSILYRAVANVLMPTVLQPLPESLTQVIQKFSIQLDDWLHEALDNVPYNIQRIKFDLAKRFSQVLKRQTSLNHLCQAARTVITSAEITSQMLDDWFNVDLNSIIKQTLYTMENNNDEENIIIVRLARDFEILLEDQAPLESYVEWLNGMIEQCVVQKSQSQPLTLKKTARQFLLMWSCIGTRVIRDMTLHSAPSFGSFHLLHLMFDEYVLYTVENLHNQEKANELLNAVKGETNLDFLDNLLQPSIHGPKPDRFMRQTQPHDMERISVIREPGCSNVPESSCMVPQFFHQAVSPNTQPSVVEDSQRSNNILMPTASQVTSVCKFSTNQYNQNYGTVHVPTIVEGEDVNPYHYDWTANAEHFTTNTTHNKCHNDYHCPPRQSVHEHTLSNGQYFNTYGADNNYKRTTEDSLPNMTTMYQYHVT